MTADVRPGDVLDRPYWCPGCSRFTRWRVVDPDSETEFAECAGCGYR